MKIVLDDVAGGYNLQKINDNFQKIEDVLNDEVLFRDNPTGDPNTLEVDIDVNGKRLYNVGAPQLPSDAARLGDIPLVPFPIGTTAASLVTFVPTANIAATNVQAAIEESDTENRSAITNYIINIASSIGATFVGWVQVGTGAILRSVFDKLRDFTHVADFGAVGDFSNDDTAELNLALAASLSVDFGGREKNYKISAPLNLRTGHRLKGRATITQTSAQTEHFNYEGKSDIDVTGLKLVGVGTDHTESDSARAVGFFGSGGESDVTVDKCSFVNIAYTPMRAKGATNIRFTRNKVEGPGSPVLTNVSSGKSYGFLADVGCTNTFIFGNSFTKHAQGARIEASTDTFIHGNKFFGMVGQHNIYAGSGLRNLSIIGNICRNAPLINIKVQAADAVDSTNVIIKGNICDTAGDQNILLTNGTGGAGRIKGFIVKGNITLSGASSNINIQHSNNGIVEGNSSILAGQYALNLKTCDDVTIASNEFNNSGLSGMLDEATSTRIVVKGNTFRDCARLATVSDRYGMRINNCTGWVVDGNTFSDANAKMDHAVFIVGGTQNTMVLTNNYAYDSVIAGLRAISGQSLKAYFGNFWGGPLASSVDPVAPTVASVAALTIPQGHEVVHISGTTAITSILVNGHTGKCVKLILDSTAQITDGSNLIIAGNFTGGANRTITLACDGLNWYETGRSTN